MKLTKVCFILFYLILSNVFLLAQVVYEPLYKDVYSFLTRLSTKGIIEYNDEIRPLSRMYIAEKLLEAGESQSNLTAIEKEELEFYKKDYYLEFRMMTQDDQSKNLNYVGYDPASRLRAFSYSDELFKFNLSPVLGYEIGSIDKEKSTHLWNGVYTYGYISDVLGVSFDFRDNTETGNTIDKFKKFTPVTGVNARSDNNLINYPADKIEYSEAKGVIATNWSWGTFAVGKEFFEWGYGESGLLVLSQKAPSFPFIRLDINPADWFGFNYIHAWLSSDVIDSTSFYYTSTDAVQFSYREKYIASHSIFIRPVKGLKFSLGESIVYSDKLEIPYLIPVMFFRLADHYLSRHSNAAGANAQIFFSVSSRNQIKNTHLYGTLLIDEIVIGGLFNSSKERNQIGFNIGASVVDIPIDNLTLTAEYTKIYPFVYTHFIQTQTYQSASYNLGNWMGNNNDQVYGSLKYRFIRRLEAELWARYIRKGGQGKPKDQYEQPQPPFLFGLRTNYTYFGVNVKYEFIHELFVRFRFQNMKVSQELENFSFEDKNISEFNFAVYYGM